MPGETYRIGEVAELLGVEASALRFWEKEFPQLSPSRTPGGQRLYGAQDVLLLQEIRRLLYEEGMTLEGARRLLDRGSELSPQATGKLDQESMSLLLEELAELRSLLAGGKKS